MAKNYQKTYALRQSSVYTAGSMASSRHFSDWPILGRGLTILCIVLGILLGGAVGVAVSPSMRTAVLRMALAVTGTTVLRDEHGFTNILLLGVGDEHHDGSDLTDTMIVVSIDESTDSVVLLSLPRDLLIESNEKTVGGRINAMYANEKRRLEIREKMSKEQAAMQALHTLGDQIGKKLGMRIHGVLKADFTALIEAVDALGGVDVDVPEDITDYTYPIAEDQVGLFHVKKGVQHFDGETALRYARSRHSTSDFDRSARQQLLLSALAAKAKTLSMNERITAGFDVYQRLQSHILSTLSTGQIILLAQIGSTIPRDNMIAMQLNYSVGGDGIEAAAGGFVIPAPPEFYEGASVLLPLPLPGKEPDWSQIRTFAQFLLQKRDVYLSRAAIQIRDAGAGSYQTWRLRNELLRYGFHALPIEKVTSGSGVTDYSGSYYRENDFKSVGTFAGNLLSLPVARMTDEETGSGDVILLLGPGFRFQPFETLSGAVLP